MLSVRWIPMVGMEVVKDGDDCDDADDTIYPTAPEICDGLINTCGGSLPTNEVDDDSDGYVECDFHNEGWDGDSGVTGDNDCDDGDNTIYPSLQRFAMVK